MKSKTARVGVRAAPRTFRQRMPGEATEVKFLRRSIRWLSISSVLRCDCDRSGLLEAQRSADPAQECAAMSLIYYAELDAHSWVGVTHLLGELE